MTSVKELYDAVHRNNWLVLDTETTGLERPAEICQLAIIDHLGNTLLNTLVDPKGDISPGAHRVHGITKLHTEGQPQWPVVKAQMLDIISGKDLFIYNATFDRKLMHWSDEAWGLGHFEYKVHANFLCAMEAYAEFWGEKHPYYGSYRWQKLTLAMEQQGEMEVDAHSAWGDACMTQWLVIHMAHVYHDKLSWNQLTGKDEGKSGG